MIILSHNTFGVYFGYFIISKIWFIFNVLILGEHWKTHDRILPRAVAMVAFSGSTLIFPYSISGSFPHNTPLNDSFNIILISFLHIIHSELTIQLFLNYKQHHFPSIKLFGAILLSTFLITQYPIFKGVPLIVRLLGISY